MLIKRVGAVIERMHGVRISQTTRDADGDLPDRVAFTVAS
jgi:hypothetical protein